MVVEDERAVGMVEQEPAGAGIAWDAVVARASGARALRRGASGPATDGPFAETKEVIAGYPRLGPVGETSGD